MQPVVKTNLDVHDKITRSRNMSAIRSKDTKPELLVRKIAWGLGYRYRINHKLSAGRPDLVFVGKKKSIFVHGCFWHRHKGCRYATTPAANARFWKDKFSKNILRDRKIDKELREKGWKILTIWECETRDLQKVTSKIEQFLTN